MRSREMSGAKRRAESRNAMPVKSAVVVNTFRCPATRAFPNVESKKYFCPISQLKISRGPEAQACASGFGGTSHGTAPTCGAPPIVSVLMPCAAQSLALGSRGLAYRRFTSEYSKPLDPDRKSTRLNSSHLGISYAVF